MRSQDAAVELQEKFLAKKKRRIELLQSQSKEVHLSKLSVKQFSDLLFNGSMPSVDPESKLTANMPENLVMQSKNATTLINTFTKGGASGNGMQVDQSGTDLRFSHEVKPSALTNSTSTADKIKQRNMLLEAYASKELQASQSQQQPQ